jgi:hypothetical protein
MSNVEYARQLLGMLLNDLERNEQGSWTRPVRAKFDANIPTYLQLKEIYELLEKETK